MTQPTTVDFAYKNKTPYSGTGLIWKRIADPGTANWRSAAYSPKLKRWVLVKHSGSANSASYSDDLVNWTLRPLIGNAWRVVRWGHDRFMTVSINGAGDRAAYSVDGINWTVGASASDQNWRDVAYSPPLGRWVAVASSGLINQRVMTSDDRGATWASRNAATADDWYGVDWSPTLNLFVAVASTGVGTRVMSSPDGINWTTRVNPIDNNWKDVIWCQHHGLFVAGADSGVANRVMTSPDGINWTIQQSMFTDSGLYRMATDNEGKKIAAIDDLAPIYPVVFSADGKGWVHSSFEQITGVQLQDVAYGDGKFLAVGLTELWLS